VVERGGRRARVVELEAGESESGDERFKEGGVVVLDSGWEERRLERREKAAWSGVEWSGVREGKGRRHGRKRGKKRPNARGGLGTRTRTPTPAGSGPSSCAEPWGDAFRKLDQSSEKQNVLQWAAYQ
jgi:hypothetical protein